MRLNNLSFLKLNRKELRKKLTPAEARLWKYIKGNSLGYKFRRQHSFGNYILDFYCPDRLLAIELDGSPHDTEQGFSKDREREEYLKAYSIEVIRFENKDVIKNLEGVLTEIQKHLAN
jgi:very-short-patch-repair endonuclease